jgi:c-di-GMP-binding flagellar brake protein YcgR
MAERGSLLRKKEFHIKTPLHTDREMTGMLKYDNSGERRRSERLKLFIPVKVTGKNMKAESFTEETFLRDISPGGASLIIENLVSRETVFLMQLYPAGAAAVKIKAKVTRIDDVGDKQGVGVVFECAYT